MDYWKECITEALEESGIKATDKQIENIIRRYFLVIFVLKLFFQNTI